MKEISIRVGNTSGGLPSAVIDAAPEEQREALKKQAFVPSSSFPIFFHIEERPLDSINMVAEWLRDAGAEVIEPSRQGTGRDNEFYYQFRFKNQEQCDALLRSIEGQNFHYAEGFGVNTAREQVKKQMQEITGREL